jgi:hypothetical protein
LFHSQTDDTVPYANTTTAKAAMDLRGALAVTVVNCLVIVRTGGPYQLRSSIRRDMITFSIPLATGL